MTQAPTRRSSLAFFLSPNGTKTLVLVQNYGAIRAVLLSDEGEGLSAVMRIPVKVAGEFLQTYCNDMINPELNDYYDKIQLYLTSNRLTILGPLSSARAAYAMQQFQVNEAEAIELAAQQARTLLDEHALRNKNVDELLAAEHERTSGFSVPQLANADTILTVHLNPAQE